MPTTVGRPPVGQSFLDRWAQDHGESERRRVYGDPVEPELPAEPEQEPEPRRRITSGAMLAAVANAMGVEPGADELDGIGFTSVDAAPPSEPERVPEPSEQEPHARAYVVREGDWRERHGLRRKRKSVPPSRTREGRRAAHIARRAAELGISAFEAEQLIPRRAARRERAV